MKFIPYPNWEAPPATPANKNRRLGANTFPTWYAFSSSKFQGPVCYTRASAFVHWFAHRFFPDVPPYMKSFSLSVNKPPGAPTGLHVVSPDLKPLPGDRPQ